MGMLVKIVIDMRDALGSCI